MRLAGPACRRCAQSARRAAALAVDGSFKAPLVSGSGRTGPAIESIHLVLILRAELHDHVGDLRRMDLKTRLFNVAPGRQVDDDPRRLA